MKKRLLYWLGIGLLLVAGCAPTTYRLTGSWFGPAYTPDGNSYYHYLRSQYAFNHGESDEAIRSLQKSVRSDPQTAFLQRELAELLVDGQKHQQALGVIQDLLEKQPHDIEGLKIQADILRKHGDPRDAAAVYSRIIKKDPSQLDMYLQLTEIFLKTGQYQKAQGVAAEMVVQHPRSAAASFLLGSIYLRLKQFMAAETAFLKTISLRPTVMSTRFELAYLYQQWVSDLQAKTMQPGRSLRDMCAQEFETCSSDLMEFIEKANPDFSGIADSEQAIKLPTQELARSINRHGSLEKRRIDQLQRILDVQPENVRAAMELGLVFHKNNASLKSETLFENLGRRSVFEAEIILRVIQLYLDKEQFEDALVVLNGMLKGAPDSSEIHHLIGWTYHDLKRLNTAETHFRRVRRSSIFFKDAVTHLAWIFQATGRNKEGIRYLTKVVETDRDVWEYYYYLAILYENRNNYSKAADLMSKALAINPENEDLHFRMGVILDKWGKKDQSLAQMRKVIRIAPQHANALNYLGYTYAEMGRNLDEAERLVGMALKYKPDDGYITDSMGWVLYKKGDYRKALDYLLRAAQLEPQDPVILEHIGDTYLQLRQPQRALESYRKSMMLAPEEKSRVEKKIMNLSP